MKNQNPQTPVLIKKISPRQGLLWLVLFFVGATLFSWLISYKFFLTSWHYLAIFYQGTGNEALAGTMPNKPANEAASARLLDGVFISEDKSKTWPYAVMIENLLSVRPQSGLSQAAVVYETLAEGGSTRFMAVFDVDEKIPEIMPVRSARPYYLEWLSEYGALYAHAGGSPKALTVIRENADINDLDALTRDGKYFWRDKTKPAPHNLVTSSEKMMFALRDKGWLEKEASFRSWQFKDGEPLTNRGDDGKKASFNFSSGKTYKVDYQYQREKNAYSRFNADQPHLDKNTGQQIEVKNVIVQVVKKPVLAGEKGRLDIYVGGMGKAWIFRDGKVIEGTWKKESRTGRTLFYDGNGKEIQLNRGNTWIHVIPETQEVIYQ